MPDAHLDGVAVIDKPPGMTSHDVVNYLRRALGTKAIGHAGTLDPDATGVLILAVGRATRLLRFIQSQKKTYLGKIHFGAQTSSLDSSGELLEAFDMTEVSKSDISSAMSHFLGRIEQLPPMVSSVKVNGVRLHKLARQGLEVERKPREVEIYDFSLTDIEYGQDQGIYFQNTTGLDPYPAGPTVSVKVTCSSGTYIRSLADDLGKLLKGGAFLSDLRRISSGNFDISESRQLEEVSADKLLAPLRLVDFLPKVTVPADLLLDVTNGKVFYSHELSHQGSGPWVLLKEDGELLAVYESYRDEAIKPIMVLRQYEKDV